MLDQLVESKSNSRENTRRAEFLAVVFIIMVSLLIGSVTYSLFAKEVDIDRRPCAHYARCPGSGRR